MKKNYLHHHWIIKSKVLVCMMMMGLTLFLALPTGAQKAPIADKETSGKITLKLVDVTLKEALNALQKNTPYRFLYNTQLINEKQIVSIDASNEGIKGVLSKLFSTINIEYKLIGSQIILTPKDSSNDTANDSNSARKESDKTSANDKASRIIKGRVVNEKGEGIPGASVSVLGTTLGIATDIKGDFTLTIPSNTAIIAASFIGYGMVEKKVEANVSNYTFQLTPSSLTIDDVVIIGYGAKSKRNVTSSVSSVKGDELMKIKGSASSFDNMIGGAIKGVMVTQNSGKPGSAATINVRGITSPTSQSTNEPLYVIDGVSFFLEKNGLNPLLSISPNDIESIDVLKDAAATSIYGSRGANGVIIVNTKSGRRNERLSVTAGYSLTIGNPVKTYKPLNAQEFKNLQDVIFRNSVEHYNLTSPDMNWMLMMSTMANITPNADGTFTYSGLNNDGFGSANTNWNDEVLNKNAIANQFSLGIRGGSENANYAFSFASNDQDGLYINDNFKHYGTRLFLDANLSKKLKIGSTLNYSYTKRKTGEWQFSDGDTDPWLFRPDITPKNESGEYNRIDGTMEYGAPFMLANPVAMLSNNSKNESYQFVGNAFVEYQVIKGLKFRADINLASFQGADNWFMPTFAQLDMSSLGIPLLSTLTLNKTNLFTSSINTRLDYEWSYDKHRFNAMIGGACDRDKYIFEMIGYKGSPDDDVLNDLNSAYAESFHSSSISKSGLNSIYSRISYNYDSKYLAEVNFRTDASSKFGPGNKRGYFPSVSLGWRIKQEDFLKSNESVSDLKLRLSWGQTGSTNLPNFAYKQFFLRSSRNNYGGNPSIVLDKSLPNSNVKWEMTDEVNAGLDFSFFNNKLFGSVDGYYRYTTGALAPTPPPLESGMTAYTSNLIDVSNKGMEFELGSDIFRTADVTWTTKLNMAFNRNRIENLNGASINPYQIDSYLEGYPAGTLKGYVVEGIFQSQEEVNKVNTDAQNAGKLFYQNQSTGIGDYKYKDLNGDNVIDNKDRKVIATPEPKLFGGLSSSASYKKFSLSVLFQFSYGAKAMMQGLRSDAFGYIGRSIYPEVFENMWSPENPNGRYARLIYSDPSNNSRTSDRFVFSTSYFRLKNISLSYDFINSTFKKIGINSAAVYVTASNLFTVSKWPGIDPELVGSGGVLSQNVYCNEPYPLSRNFTFGVNLQF